MSVRKGHPKRHKKHVNKTQIYRPTRKKMIPERVWKEYAQGKEEEIRLLVWRRR